MKNIDDVIRFSKSTETYGIFSNFAPTPFELDGRTWPTAEHFYQAAKTEVPEEIEAIANAESAKEAKRLGNGATLRPHWNELRDDVMRRALAAKYAIPGCRATLLSTGESRLIEHAPWDKYWGDGGDDSGQNRLGELLMELREQIREEESEQEDE